MAVSLDVYSSNIGIFNSSFNHAGGTPEGVLIFVSSQGLECTGVSYGGEPLTEVPDVSPVIGVTELDGHETSAWFLPSGAPSGTQQVVVDGDGPNSDEYLVFVYSLDADAPLEVVDAFNLTSGPVQNPSDTLALGDRECFVAMGFQSGISSTGNAAPITTSGTWNQREEFDNGSEILGTYSFNTIGGGNVVAGVTYGQTSEDTMMIAVGVAEVEDAPELPSLTDVDTDEVVQQGQTGATYTASNIGEDENDRTIWITQGEVSVQQTETSGDDEGGTFNVVRGGLKFGTAEFEVIRTDDESDSLEIEFETGSGELWVDLTGFDEENGLQGDPSDPVAGDQIHAYGVGGGAAPTGLGITTLGVPFFSAGNDPAAFEYEIWDQSTQDWGDPAVWTPAGDEQEVDAGLAAETDAALAVTRRKALALALAEETDSTLAPAAAKPLDVGLAASAHAAQDVAVLKRLAAGLATETDAALGLSSGSLVSVGLTTESDSPLAIAAHKALSVGQAQEAAEALPMMLTRAVDVGMASESCESLGVTAGKAAAVGLATETSSAHSLAAIKSLLVGLAREFDSALNMVGQVAEEVGGRFLRLWPTHTFLRLFK